MIADIIGPRLPDLESIPHNKSKTDAYFKSALILFMPFRSILDLKAQFSSFKEAFESYKRTQSYLASGAPVVLQNMQEFYNGKRRAAEQRRMKMQENHENEDSVDHDTLADGCNAPELREEDSDTSDEQEMPGDTSQCLDFETLLGFVSSAISCNSIKTQDHNDEHASDLHLQAKLITNVAKYTTPWRYSFRDETNSHRIWPSKAMGADGLTQENATMYTSSKITEEVQSKIALVNTHGLERATCEDTSAGVVHSAECVLWENLRLLYSY